MTDQRRHLATLRFSGGTYDGCALDERALEEVVKFIRAVSETAKEQWRQEHPKRSRLPNGFASSVALQLKEIAPGGTTAFLSPPPSLDTQLPLGETNLDRALATVEDAFAATRAASDPSRGISERLCHTYAQLGTKLEASATLTFSRADGPSAIIDQISRQAFSRHLPDTYVDIVDVSGRVLAADVRLQTFQLWLDQDNCVVASFTPDQERHITTALHDHESLQLRVRGIGEFLKNGALYRINRIDLINELGDDQFEFDHNAPSVVDLLDKAFTGISDSDWKGLPLDLASRHDDLFSNRSDPE